MIENLSEFVVKYKAIIDNQLDIYNNETQRMIKWQDLDFDVAKISEQLGSTSDFYAVSVVKKAYDVIRTYHRMFTIYSMGREDYYRFGIMEIEKDKLIIDIIVNNLQKVYTNRTEGVPA